MIINNSNRAITTHCFDVDDAVKHGVEKAILLYNIKFWLEHNRANNTNFHDGKWWTFNSADAFATLFPYLNSKKISRLLKELENDGVILVGNYNKKGYDRTKWYSTPYHASFPKNEKWISQICEMDIPDLSNAFPKFEQPIPDVNANINSDVNTDKKDIDVEVKKASVKSEKFVPANYPTPLFIDKETWAAFHEMRDAKKKTATEYACKLLVNKLTKFNNAGFDANTAIENSITNGWTDVFQPKTASNQKGLTHAKQQTPFFSAANTAQQQPSAVELEIQRLRAERGNSNASDGIRTVS